MDTPPQEHPHFHLTSGNMMTTSFVEALPRQLPSGKKVFIHNTSVGFEFQHVLEVWQSQSAVWVCQTEMVPQVGCLSGSYSLCFFNSDQNLLGDGQTSACGWFCLCLISSAQQACISAALLRARKKGGSDPLSSTKFCFPQNNSV